MMLPYLCPTLESCLASLHCLFCHNGLALNPSKSEAIIFGTRQRLNSFPRPSGIHIVGSPVSISDHITTSGVTLDSNMTLNIHVSSVCKTARPVLTCDMARAVAASLIQTCFDCANSVLILTSSSNIYKLQRVQNCLAKVVLQDVSKSVTSLLSQIHWLPVSKRIQLKIATLTYQLVSFGQPTYLSSVSFFLISLRGHSVQSVRTCYPYHAQQHFWTKKFFLLCF